MGRMAAAATKQVTITKQKLSQLSAAKVMQNPLNYLEERRLLLDFIQQKLSASAERQLAQQKQKFVQMTAWLDAMSPLNVLQRGFCVVQNDAGQIVHCSTDVVPNENILIRTSDGTICAVVQEGKEEMQ